MKQKRNRKPRDKSRLPPLEQRLIFVQFIRRQRSRYNQSFSTFLRLPHAFQQEVLAKWEMSHPRMKLPEFEVSAPRKKVKK